MVVGRPLEQFVHRWFRCLHNTMAIFVFQVNNFEPVVHFRWGLPYLPTTVRPTCSCIAHYRQMLATWHLVDNFVRSQPLCIGPIMYGQLASGSRPTGRPALHYKDVCMCDDLKAGSLNPADLEAATADRASWQLTVKSSIKLSERKREKKFVPYIWLWSPWTLSKNKEKEALGREKAAET